MEQRKRIETERLVLRPFNLDDALEVQHLAGNRAIADTTLNIPFPYEDGMAEEWIGTHEEQFKDGKGVTFAVILRDSSQLVGAIGITNKEHDRGEMGYWIGQPYWNQGYATEAAQAIVAYGFGELTLNKISATHLVRNPASGRVMEKAGMGYEGCSPQHVKKWGHYEDMAFYGILGDDFRKDQA
jgi:RimJ/RimL family protein N-acetyltransferase